MHLDFADTPRRTWPTRFHIAWDYNQVELSAFQNGRLMDTARKFARTLAPSLKSIWLVYPEHGKSVWTEFRIVPVGSAGTEQAQVEC